jgi:LacI family transcriptional regulator
MAIRLKDIARDLNVSIITVSKALRGHTDISEATRQRVLTRMKELDYQPNMAARSLATGQSSILGLIVPDLVHPFFAELAKSLGGTLRKRGYGLILASSEEDPAIEQAEIRMMLARGVDALLIASCQPGLQAFDRVHNHRTPYVLLDRSFPDLGANFVGTNDYMGGILGTEHLIQIGRKRLAHIGGPDLSPAIDRLRGFHTAMRQHGIEVRDNFILKTSRVEESGDEAGYAMMQQLLSGKSRPNGVFCYNDITAIGAMQATLDAGLSIPRDIAFVGFGNVRYSKYLQIPLTSLDQHTTRLGAEAAELALDLALSKQDSLQTITLEPALVIRESTVSMSPAKRPSPGVKKPARTKQHRNTST